MSWKSLKQQSLADALIVEHAALKELIIVLKEICEWPRLSKKYLVALDPLNLLKLIAEFLVTYKPCPPKVTTHWPLFKWLFLAKSIEGGEQLPK
jgi:hypothetical protein